MHTINQIGTYLRVFFNRYLLNTELKFKILRLQSILLIKHELYRCLSKNNNQSRLYSLVFIA